MVEVKDKMKDIRLVSLFAGCGGLDLGFEKAGFHRVWANDFDKDAQAVFNLNLGDIDGRDIRDVPTEDIPECDILTAGFPCQPFSNAGNATLVTITTELIDDNLKRRFVAGLADTVGSTAKSHRRFTDEVQIISFEISGYRFDFVCQLCQLLYSVNCYPDQILWNHPNFHSGNDPYYSTWKKGFKLRVELDQYAKFGAFAFRTKAESANENRSLQTQTNVA